MSSRKVYGRDGPPQLRGRVEDATPEVLGEWAAGGAYWLRPQKPRAAGDWEKLVRCTCGRRDGFEVRSAGSDQPGWVGGRHSAGTFRCDLSCTHCGSDFILFDDGIHGYDAVVNDERSHLPPGYLEANRHLLKPRVCACGGRLFSVIAGATYDRPESTEELPESQWDDAYGWFHAAAKCSRCGKADTIVDAEIT
jgi:hypothetical protein